MAAAVCSVVLNAPGTSAIINAKKHKATVAHKPRRDAMRKRCVIR